MNKGMELLNQFKGRTLTTDDIKRLKSYGLIPVGPSSKEYDCVGYFSLYLENVLGYSYRFFDSFLEYGMQLDLMAGRINLYESIPENSDGRRLGIIYYRDVREPDASKWGIWRSVNHIGIVFSLKNRPRPLVISKMAHEQLFLHSPDNQVVEQLYTYNSLEGIKTGGFLYFYIDELVEHAFTR